MNDAPAPCFRSCLQVTFLARLCQRHLWSIWHIFTSCVNNTVGIHSTHFYTVRKRCEKRYMQTRPKSKELYFLGFSSPLTVFCLMIRDLISSCLVFRNSSEESDRNQAMLSALATFFRQVGVPISNKNASSTQLERCQSFVAKDRKVFPKFKSKQKVTNSVVYLQPKHSPDVWMKKKQK